MKIFSTVSASVLTVFLCISAYGQRFVSDGFDIPPATLFADLKSVKLADPKITPENFVIKANEALNRSGLPFTFVLDDRVCESVAKALASQKDKNASKNLRTNLASDGGQSTELILPPAEFSNNQCAKCTLTIPVFEVTDTHFIAPLRGINIKFVRPQGLDFSTYYLVKESNLSEITSKWRMPFRSTPIAASYDGGVVYIGLDDPDLKDIVLMVFSEGVFQFTTRKDAEAIGKGILLEQPKEQNTSFLKFKNHDVTQVIRYNEPCKP